MSNSWRTIFPGSYTICYEIWQVLSFQVALGHFFFYHIRRNFNEDTRVFMFVKKGHRKRPSKPCTSDLPLCVLPFTDFAFCNLQKFFCTHFLLPIGYVFTTSFPGFLLFSWFLCKLKNLMPFIRQYLKIFSYQLKKYQSGLQSYFYDNEDC